MRNLLRDRATRRRVVVATFRFTPSLVGRSLRVATVVWALAAAGCQPAYDASTVERKASTSLVAGVPQHPFMAANGTSNMHHDSYMSDVYQWAGPRGDKAEIKVADIAGNPIANVAANFKEWVGGQCPTQAFLKRNGKDYVLAMCITGGGPKLILFTADLREPEWHRLDLPQRPSAAKASLDVNNPTFFDTSGVYFYLDDQGRAIVAAADRTIKIVEVSPETGPFLPALRVVKSIDLGPSIDAHGVPGNVAYPDNPVTSALPDFDGNLWWVTRYGVVGVLPAGWQTDDIDAQSIRSIQLRADDQLQSGDIEEVENTFAAGEDGVFIISDHALYRFSWQQFRMSKQRWLWRWDYSKFRGNKRKPGMINQGSGTTPTLFDSERERLVTVADNDEPRMNVWVLDRQEGKPLCKVPVFAAGRSATENSLAAHGRSIVVGNTYGATPIVSGDAPQIEPGLARIDVGETQSCRAAAGTKLDCCRVRWAKNLNAGTAVPKLSLAAPATIYLYNNANHFDSQNAKSAAKFKSVDWYLTGIDFEKGDLQFAIEVGGGGFGLLPTSGDGRNFGNNYSPVSLAPDGTAYVGIWNGIAAIRDRGFAPSR